MPTRTAQHPRQDHSAGRRAHHCASSAHPPTRSPRPAGWPRRGPGSIRRIDADTCHAAAQAAPGVDQRALWLALAASAQTPASQPHQLIAVDTTDGRIFYAFGGDR